MTIKEFVDSINKDKNKIQKAEQLQASRKKKLEVKEYMSIKQKKELVESIVNECVLFDDGIFKFDEIEKYIVFTMKVIEAYTNLELSDDMENDYDMLCESKMLEPIISTFKKEYDDVNVLLQMKCDYILNDNNIEAQVGKFLNGLLEKLDDFASVLNAKFGDFDMGKLPVSKEELNKLIDFVDSQK